MDTPTKLGIATLVITILIPVIGFLAKLVMSPKLKFQLPIRDYRPWLDLVEASPYNAFLAAGTATIPNIAYLQSQNLLPQQAVSMRYYIFMPIKNDTTWKFEYSTAKNVHAELIFCDLKKNRIGEFKGRWQSKQQPRFLENKTPLYNIDIQAGSTENLDFASKKMTSSEWYVMNNDNYDKPDDSEIQINRIGVGGFIVHIKLSGENVDLEEIIYQVIDNGGTEPSYIKLESIYEK